MQELMTIKDLAKKLKAWGFIKEANLIQKVQEEVPFGEITIITRDGRIQRVKREVEFDDLSAGGL